MVLAVTAAAVWYLGGALAAEWYMPAAEWYPPESLTELPTTAAAEWYMVAAEWAAFCGVSGTPLRRFGRPIAAEWARTPYIPVTYL